MFEEWGGIDPLSTLQPGQTFTIGGVAYDEIPEGWPYDILEPVPTYEQPVFEWPAPGAVAPPEELLDELPEGFVEAPAPDELNAVEIPVGESSDLGAVSSGVGGLAIVVIAAALVGALN